MNHIIQGQREVKLFLLYNVIIFQVITNNAESFRVTEVTERDMEKGFYVWLSFKLIGYVLTMQHMIIEVNLQKLSSQA